MVGLTTHCKTLILEGAWPGLWLTKQFQLKKYRTISQTFNCLKPFRAPRLLAKVRTLFWREFPL